MYASSTSNQEGIGSSYQGFRKNIDTIVYLTYVLCDCIICYNMTFQTTQYMYQSKKSY